MTFRPATAVLFDWGHTLFDTAGSVEFIEQWAADRGRPLAVGEAEHLYRESIVSSRRPEELAKGRDLSMERHRECWIALWSDLDAVVPGVAPALYVFETTAAGWSPYPDTRAVLETLHADGIPVVIVSDVPFDLRPIFAAHGLDHLVHTFVLSAEHGATKAQGAVLFDIALRSVGRTTDEVIMVGDNPANDGAAVSVGIRTLLLPHPRRGEPRGLAAVLQLVGRSPTRSST